jgi:hypothetical protein
MLFRTLPIKNPLASHLPLIFVLELPIPSSKRPFPLAEVGWSYQKLQGQSSYPTAPICALLGCLPVFPIFAKLTLQPFNA